MEKVKEIVLIVFPFSKKWVILDKVDHQKITEHWMNLRDFVNKTWVNNKDKMKEIQ